MFDLIPFTRDENNLFRYLDNMERSLWSGFGDVNQFRCDIQDKGDKYLLEAELPGFQKEDISIQVDGDEMVITAHHNSEEEKKDKNYVRRERKFGSYSRSFNVSGIDTSAITASYNNGVLELNLPKQKAEVPAAKTISIEG